MPDPVEVARIEEARVSVAIAGEDHAAVANWILEGSSTRIRQMAARAVTDPEQLRELIRRTRGGNDKSVYRILTGTRDAQASEIRIAQKRQAEIDGAAAAISRHAGHPYDASYAAVLEHLEAQWGSLGSNASPHVQGEVAQQLERAREIIEHNRREREAEVERLRLAAVATEEARRYRELEAEAASVAATAAAAEQARILKADCQARLAQQQAEDAELQGLMGLLRQAQAALDQGESARAARLRDAIAERLPRCPVVPAWVGRQLEQMEIRVEELKDWKTFTVVPKRAALTQQMQSLIGATLSYEELARRIRRLQDDWKTLNRGVGAEDGADGQQFRAASELAYEPCREHFARQAALRRENEAKREALLDRLEAFAAAHTPENTHWPTVIRAISESRREWRQHAPVGRDAVQSLQARFHALTGALRTRLETEYARNAQAKRDLIKRAGELLEVADTRKAIDAAMVLQQTWRTVGIVPRDVDNPLWEEFRRHCDAIFERRAQESATYTATLDANSATAADLCKEIERIGEFTGEALLSGVKQLRDLTTRFESLELPRAAAHDLRRRFSRANDRYVEAVHRLRVESERRAWTDLYAAAARIRAYASAVVSQRPPDECESLRMIATDAINYVGSLSKGTRAVLASQLVRAAAGNVNVDLRKNEAELRLLCVRAELMANVDTPPEDGPLRREYQLRRLVETMGRGNDVTPADLGDLVAGWIAVGPVEAAVHDVLLTRFERCRNELVRRSGNRGARD